MINVAVINLKSLIKNFIKLIIILVIIFLIIIIIRKIDISSTSLSIFNNLKFIDDTILVSSYFNKDISKPESALKKILVSELAIFSKEEELMEKENQEEIEEFQEIIEVEQEENKENKEIQENDKIFQENLVTEIDTSLPTEVISTNNKKDTFTNTYNNVKIKNESQYQLTEEMLIPNVELSNKKDIIIYHTHTCESYTPTELNNYVATGNFRTTDLNYSVVRVGTELANNLQARNFNVIHNTTYHDYPAYTGSYTRSLSTIKSILNDNKDTEFIIDLHRDALGNNSEYGPSVKIGEEKVAQIMFVIGTDAGGLEHKDWLYNFKLAIKIQEKANQMYPGLFKPIILRDSRYNQHVTKGACIIICTSRWEATGADARARTSICFLRCSSEDCGTERRGTSWLGGRCTGRRWRRIRHGVLFAERRRPT